MRRDRSRHGYVTVVTWSDMRTEHQVSELLVTGSVQRLTDGFFWILSRGFWSDFVWRTRDLFHICWWGRWCWNHRSRHLLVVSSTQTWLDWARPLSYHPCSVFSSVTTLTDKVQETLLPLSGPAGFFLRFWANKRRSGWWSLTAELFF